MSNATTKPQQSKRVSIETPVDIIQIYNYIYIYIIAAIQSKKRRAPVEILFFVGAEKIVPKKKKLRARRWLEYISR